MLIRIDWLGGCVAVVLWAATWQRWAACVWLGGWVDGVGDGGVLIWGFYFYCWWKWCGWLRAGDWGAVWWILWDFCGIFWDFCGIFVGFVWGFLGIFFCKFFGIFLDLFEDSWGMFWDFLVLLKRFLWDFFGIFMIFKDCWRFFGGFGIFVVIFKILLVFSRFFCDF